MQTHAQTPVKTRPHLLFFLATLLVYLPVLFSLAMIRAQWYGWVTAAFSYALLFRMRRSTLWHGWRSVLCFAGAYMIAFLGLYSARPVWDVSLTAQIGGGAVRTFARLPKQEQAAGISLLTDTGWTPPEGYELEVVRLEHSTLEMLTKTGSASRYAVLQLHGGAFVSGMNNRYRQIAVEYSQIFNDCLVASLDYRLAPEFPYPSQQEDTLDAWAYLTGTLGYAAERIVVAGDSAGGNLALSLGLRLRDGGRAMPLAFVCMSPWADLSNSGASHIYNATLDPSFGIDEADFHGQAVGVDTTYPDGLDATDPNLSPAYGDYAGFPPMLLQAGSVEVLLSDSEMVYDNAKSHGVDCTLTVYKGMFHVFQAMLNLAEESRLAWREVGVFLERVAGLASD
jgi:epsilon-lactone hydrolase